MTTRDFTTPDPVQLFVELGKGTLTITATDTVESHVEISGRDAERVLVEQSGDRLSIIDQQGRGPFNFTHQGYDVTVVVPTASRLAVKTGSAAVTVAGSVAASLVRTGSGDIDLERLTGASAVETGSGRIAVHEATAELRVKSGSGDVSIGSTGAAVVVSTGSGDVELGRTRGPVSVKTGSGDLRIGDAEADISLSTGSGDLEVSTVRRGKIVGKGASGDIRVGVPQGVPVWTDIATVTGQIRSGLHGTGQPADGQDHVELRARTVTGDVTLVEV
jgi:DUF4097 and DUF4098 domain-containing protein YvlB